jgi:predicted  nucleic acid-binding Zn-ribbon protein
MDKITIENETLKNDFKILKSYARKISGVNKLLIKILEESLSWIRPEGKIDYENMTEALAQELIEAIQIWNQEKHGASEEIRELKNLLENEREAGNEITKQLQEQRSFFTRLRDELSSMMNGTPLYLFSTLSSVRK